MAHRFWPVALAAGLGISVILFLLLEGTVAQWFGSLSNRYGKQASVLGFALSLIGLFLALLGEYRLLRVLDRTRQQTRSVVQRVRARFQATDSSTLERWLRDLRQAAFDVQWTRALFRTQECQVVLRRLAQDVTLFPEESRGLWKAADALQQLQRFIEEERSRGEPGGLDNAQIASLDEIIHLLETIQGRLLHATMEVNDGDE